MANRQGGALTQNSGSDLCSPSLEKVSGDFSCPGELSVLGTYLAGLWRFEGMPSFLPGQKERK